MDKWTKRYLKLAHLVASWSKDPSSKVGACIIDLDGNPVSFGFNGFPKGLEDSEGRLNDRTFKYTHTLHAEDNCISFSNRTYFDGCTIYITHPPCTNCLCKMKQRRLTKIVCCPGDEDFRSRWSTDGIVELAKELEIDLKFVEEN